MSDTKDKQGNISCDVIDSNLLCNGCTFTSAELSKAAKPLIRLAVSEDIPRPNLVDARMIISPELEGSATIRANSEGIFAGGWLIGQIAMHYGKDLQTRVLVQDGQRVRAGQILSYLRGYVAEIVMAERVLLNFLSRLSGIATLTRRCVDACSDSEVVITDTRKTLPGYRVLDKYAVQCGGGKNHRMGLCDGIMIKDNHISAMNSNMDISQMIRDVRNKLKQKRKKLPIWVEVDRLDQLEESLSGRPDVILLDNMSLQQLRSAVRIRNDWFARSKIKSEKPIPLLEASGGIDLSNIADVARTGVDRIAVGALTHSAPALDLSLELLNSDESVAIETHVNNLRGKDILSQGTSSE